MLWQMHLVKHLKGHSGARVSLYKQHNQYFVVKENYKKARESVDILNALPFATPHVHKVTNDSIVMEYIQGQDMKSYLESATTKDIYKLISYIEDYFDYCLDNSSQYNFYSEITNKTRSLIKNIDLTLKVNDLSSVKPKSLIHGDFTLENIIFANNKFYMIDANPTDLESIHFDGNKLRQDIDCLWFVRNEQNKLNYSINCSKISNELKRKYDFMNDDNLLIFMLSRILPYCTEQLTKDFLHKEINNIWL